MKVVWSETVLAELAEIHDWMAETSSLDAALRTIDRILGRGEQLEAFPESGRAVADFGSPSIREVVEKPYRIVYEIQGDRIEVLAIFHASRLPPWKRDLE